VKVKIPKDDVGSKVGVLEMKESLQGRGISDVVVKINHLKVEAVGPDLQELEARVGDNIIAHDNLQ